MNHSPLTLEALEVIDQIERRGSFASAAEHLNKVPSALSYIVQKLEEQLGVTLFQRQGRRSVLTPAGRHLLEEGRQLLQAAERLANQTREIAIGWEPRIRIAFDTILDFDQLLPVLQEFLQQHPQIELDIGEEVLGGTWEALIEDRVDLLIGAGGPVPPQQGLRSEKFGTLEMVFAVAAGHPLINAPQPLQKELLKAHRWVVVHDSSRFSVPRDTGRISSEERLYVRTIAQKIAAQQAGLGIGYLPKKRIREQLERGDLVELSIENSTPHINDTLVAWKTVNRGKGLQSLVKALLQASDQ
ncbi:LysR substrate-binding domain-containing protein [Pseudomaricurvus sp. HS19]|uniref:LysR substrate-binding domain-containing protein n=1 Tax=Pseudomaricurvus sp. HS19 TaxID=2692626 RepID=UPI00136DAC83|nr:LysR substrate-binding domain-containing protein [Pseudomaricurvus sp. HS19]MYM64849.1 LysR family transcriptional regulator [Pseudomaricurvus sp. HS19]